MYKFFFILKALIIIICFQSCESKLVNTIKKNNSPIIGYYSSTDRISGSLSDSLNCEGIKYELQLRADTTFMLTFSCSDNPEKIIVSEYGRWELSDNLETKLLPVNSKQWLIKFYDNYRRLIFLKRDKTELNYKYELYRDTAI